MKLKLGSERLDSENDDEDSDHDNGEGNRDLLQFQKLTIWYQMKAKEL